MQYSDFLKTVQIIRMLYGETKARRFFKENVVNFNKIVDVDKLSGYIEVNLIPVTTES